MVGTPRVAWRDVGTRYHEASMATLIATALRDACMAEAGLINGGAIRGERIYDDGEIADVHKCLSLPNKENLSQQDPNLHLHIYTYIYGNVPLIRDTANMIKCNLRIFGSNTLNYSNNHFTFLFVSL